MGFPWLAIENCHGSISHGWLPAAMARHSSWLSNGSPPWLPEPWFSAMAPRAMVLRHGSPSHGSPPWLREPWFSAMAPRAMVLRHGSPSHCSLPWLPEPFSHSAMVKWGSAACNKQWFLLASYQFRYCAQADGTRATTGFSPKQKLCTASCIP